MNRMGSKPVLSVKWSITIDTMLNIDGDRPDGDGHGDGTCKQTFRLEQNHSWNLAMWIRQNDQPIPLDNYRK